MLHNLIISVILLFTTQNALAQETHVPDTEEIINLSTVEPFISNPELNQAFLKSLHKEKSETGYLTTDSINYLLYVLKVFNHTPDQDSWFSISKAFKAFGYTVKDGKLVVKPEYLNIVKLPNHSGHNNEGVFLVLLGKKGADALRSKVQKLEPGTNELRVLKEGSLLFVFKQQDKSRGQQEFEDLKKVQKSKISNLPFPTPENGLPAIAMAERFFTYTDAQQTVHSVSVLHGARGATLSSHITKLKHTNLNALNKIVQDVGRALGALHYKLAPDKPHHPFVTLLHRDLNMGNILYDVHSKRVTLIDNGSFALSLEFIEDAEKEHTCDILLDIKTLLGDMEISGAPKETFQAFFKGYLSGYPKLWKPALKKRLVKLSLQLFNKDLTS